MILGGNSNAGVLRPAGHHADLFVAVGLLIALLAFGEALLELVYRWTHQDEYSHGFLIPIISAALLWTRRGALQANIGQPSWLGPIFILLALIMHVTGELSAFFTLSQVAFIVALFGIVLGIGGYQLLKVTFVPIAFLLFAIPLPYFIDAILTLRLQLLSSELGVFFIRLFGIPVYLDGNIVDMGDYKLQVVEACSGLRYLYPLLSLSFLAAYLIRVPLWQRALVFLSGIPIAIGMNGLRIGLVGILVDYRGNQAAEGTLHLFEGWVIFLACAALLAGEIYLLALISGKKFSALFYLPRSANDVAVKPKGKLTVASPLMICLILLCGGGLVVFALSGRSEAIEKRMRFVEFPIQLGQWKGHLLSLDAATEKGLRLDDYILSDYSHPDGNIVNFYVAYYASQRKGESPHSPIVCIPGGGWAITKLQRVNYVNLGEELSLNRVIIEKGASKQLIYYWFNERGRKIANEYWAKVLLLTDAIVMNRTDGALIRLTTDVKANEGEMDADRRLQAFMRIALPQLAEFLPSRSPSVNHRS